MRACPGIAFVVSLFLSVGCAPAMAQLTPAEEAVAIEANVDPAVAAQVRALGTSIQRLSGQTPDFNQVAADGIVVATAPNAGREVHATLRERLSGTPYSAYLLDENFGYAPDQVAVLETGDYEYLAVVRTDGINLDLEHEAVLERYKQWDAKYGLQLIGAGTDWLEAEFRQPPEDWLAFANEVYEFCPDVVDQGSGEVAALAKEMQETGRVYLWWD